MPSQLPPDLVELIIENVDGLQDLLSCSLLCHAWFPLARNRIPFYLSHQVLPGFRDLLQSPQTTLFSTVRQMKLWAPSASSAQRSILKMLPSFSRLRSLNIYCTFVDLPPLPQLTELKLSGTFASYATFVRFMSDLPALRGLSLSDLRWDDVPDPRLTFPTLHLEWVSLNWGGQMPIEHIMFSLRTRRLTWNVGAGVRDDMLPAYQKSMSKYLRHLGGHLRHFLFGCELSEHVDIAASLDFRHSTGLKRLSVGRAVRCSVFGADFEATVSPHLTTLLAKVVPHCSLATLIVSVCLETGRPPWKSLPQFAELFAAPQFSAVREIQFVIDEAFRGDFEAKLTMLSSADRVVICTDAEDIEDDSGAVWRF
ncbi:hypothetical protein B0H19DRAFT_1248658 [Mycena capillaripes]|nr:hypothetical protein B0H19DRAFT_1248658 [Mycena capillaripes]